MTNVIELVLTPRCTEAVDELERFWQERESSKRWDDSDEVCERLLDWLRRPALPSSVVARQ